MLFIDIIKRILGFDRVPKLKTQPIRVNDRQKNMGNSKRIQVSRVPSLMPDHF